MSQAFLSSRWQTQNAASPNSDSESAFSQAYFGAFHAPDSLLLGGSVRLATLYQRGDKLRFFPMQVDAYGDYHPLDFLHFGGSLGIAKVPVGSPHARAAQLTTNQGDEYNLISRTHYVRFDLDDGTYSVSVGRLNLPFGIRMSEHVMWVREQTETDRESDQEHGAALNVTFAKWRLELMAIAGNYQINPDSFRKRGYSGYIELEPWKGGAVGVSSLITHAGDDHLAPAGASDTRQAHGGFLRVALGRECVLMAEGDLLLHTRHQPGYVGFTQLDSEPVRGLHFMATGEILDSGYPKGADPTNNPRVPGLGKPKLGGWLSTQWFFISHFDARLDVIVRKQDPLQILGQLHVYL
jgi:hypothetical protein